MIRKIVKKRRTNPIVLMLCEGETEKFYLDGICSILPKDKQRAKKVVKLAKDTDPLRIVNEAIKKRDEAQNKNNPYNKIWVIFDHDNLPNRKAAYEKAKKSKLKIAYSSIAIETWFLLHFEYSARAFEKGDCLKKYMRKHISNYEPGDIDISNKIQNKLLTAKKNAPKLREQVRQNNPRTKIYDINPYTDIDILINELETL